MYSIDRTLDAMVNLRFETIYHDIIRELPSQTQFNEVEVRCILMLYHKFVLANGPRAKRMTKAQFHLLSEVMLGVTEAKHVDRMLLIDPENSKTHMGPRGFVKLLDIFMSKDLEKRMRYVFFIYDAKQQGYLTREILTKAVENFFTSGDEDEVMELQTDMVEALVTKFDVDKDGTISFEDYASVVRRQPQLLEFLGTCLPSSVGASVTAHCANVMSYILREEAKHDDDIEVHKTKKHSPLLKSTRKNVDKLYTVEDNVHTSYDSLLINNESEANLDNK